MHQPNIKRVACLYRVSSKKQVDKNDDLSMQKTACREFISRQSGWQLTNEYYEKGVSGFKKSKKDRDVLLEIEKDAKAGRFDVLLVFMFDRVGRKEEESPFVMQDLSKLGLELWSVMEGEMKFDTHIDKLLAYLRFWQSSGESIKTSIRVDEKHRQMVIEGKYRGGKSPYGYNLVLTEETNKKGDNLYDLEVNEIQAIVVKLIFELVFTRGWGSTRIQTFLNEEVKAPNASNEIGKWSRASITHILTNPIYKGYRVYGKRDNERHNRAKEEWILSEKQIPSLIIVEENIWDEVQRIRSDKAPQNKKREKQGFKKVGNTSPLLLTGFIKCGHCGSNLQTSYHYARWERKTTGEKFIKRKPVYRCTGRTDNRVKCVGKTTYRQEFVEDIVIAQTKEFIANLTKLDFTSEIIKMKKESNQQYTKRLNELKNKKESLYQDIADLKKEILNVIRGKGKFKQETLEELIQECENNIVNVQDEINKINSILKTKDLEIEDMKHLQSHVIGWSEIFDNATIDQKKILLSRVIDYVTVYKEKIEINYKIFIKNFADTVDLLHSECLVRENVTYMDSVVKMVEKQVVVMLDNIN